MPTTRTYTLNNGIVVTCSILPCSKGRWPGIELANYISIAYSSGSVCFRWKIHSRKRCPITVFSSTKIFRKPKVLSNFHYIIGLRIIRITLVHKRPQHAPEGQTSYFRRFRQHFYSTRYSPIERFCQVGSTKIRKHDIESIMRKTE